MAAGRGAFGAEPVPSIPSSYPPCLYANANERKLYKCLQKIYEQHSHTWDDESRLAWFEAIQRTSLARTAVRKMTNHGIVRLIAQRGVTWAEVVVMQVMFPRAMFRSRKVMKMIYEKYPGATFETFAFDERFRQCAEGQADARSDQETQARIMQQHRKPTVVIGEVEEEDGVTVKCEPTECRNAFPRKRKRGRVAGYKVKNPLKTIDQRLRKLEKDVRILKRRREDRI